MREYCVENGRSGRITGRPFETKGTDHRHNEAAPTGTLPRASRLCTLAERGCEIRRRDVFIREINPEEADEELRSADTAGLAERIHGERVFEHRGTVESARCRFTQDWTRLFRPLPCRAANRSHTKVWLFLRRLFLRRLTKRPVLRLMLRLALGRLPWSASASALNNGSGIISVTPRSRARGASARLCRTQKDIRRFR